MLPLNITLWASETLWATMGGLVLSAQWLWKPLENKKANKSPVPIILKKGSLETAGELSINKGCDTTYINEDVFEELGIVGEK